VAADCPQQQNEGHHLAPIARPNASTQSLQYKGQTVEQVNSFLELGMRFDCGKAFVNASISRIESAEGVVLALRSRCIALKLLTQSCYADSLTHSYCQSSFMA